MKSLPRTVIYWGAGHLIIADGNVTPRPYPIPSGMDVTPLEDTFARMAGSFNPTGGAVILTAGVVERMRLTPELITDLSGWKVTGNCGTFKLRQGTLPAISLTVIPWLSEDRTDLITGDALDIVTRYAAWHQLMGVPYLGTPGFALTSALIRMNTNSPRPAWRPAEPQPADWKRAELPYDWWCAFGPEVGIAALGAVVGADRIRAGLSTFASLEVCPWLLKRQRGEGALGTLAFHRTRAGMWLVDAPAWNDDRMPDPFNRSREELDHGRSIWRATPTLALAEDLVGQGALGEFKVYEAYTGPSRRLFRTWAERSRDAWRALETPAYGKDLRDVIKTGYGATHGGMSRDSTGGVTRLDWYAAHHALARATVWRAAWKALMAGYPPVMIHRDAVYYPADAALIDYGLPGTYDISRPDTPYLGRWRQVTR